MEQVCSLTYIEKENISNEYSFHQNAEAEERRDPNQIQLHLEVVTFLFL